MPRIDRALRTALTRGRVRFAALTALILAVLSASPGPERSDSRSYDITWPAYCLPEAEPGNSFTLSCYFTSQNGGQRKVALQEVQVPVARLSPEEQAEFWQDPVDTMTGILRAFEADAVNLPPGPNQVLVHADSFIQDAALNPEGLDVCLRFDFDYIEVHEDGSALRIDDTGLRCMAFRAGDGLITSVRLEYLQAHADLTARAPGFEADAEAIIRSLHRR